MKNLEKQKILSVIRGELGKILGEDLDQIILYGSHARGDARSDSDLDVQVVIKGEVDSTRLIRQTSELISRLSLENDIVISRAFISKERYLNEVSPFILNVRREGIAI
jgi:predicted nucleotidyltransferase